ncbi:hypothetical protein SDC9_195259 [bioreactor metagenome]|uniref:Uncharacterized protein n=1 Tax=bioreactor metagenome TaxID=1076179 RepID=A0A645I8I2_9ZZZZ
MLARNGDDRHVQRGIDLERAVQRRWLIGGGLCLRLFIEQFLYLFHRRRKRSVVFALYGNEEIVRGNRALQLRRRNADVLRNFLIQIRPHADERFVDAVELLEFLRNQHEGDGIIIGILSDFQFYHVVRSLHSTPAARALRR